MGIVTRVMRRKRWLAPAEAKLPERDEAVSARDAQASVYHEGSFGKGSKVNGAGRQGQALD